MPLFARPDGDVSTGNWTATPDLWQKIDETPFSDTDFVQSENDPSNDIMEVTLTNVADPASSTGHIVRYRLARNQSGGGQPGTLNVIVGLYQATTLIATATHSNIGLGFAEFSFTLTGTEADNITDYTDLRIRFDADKSAGARTTWCELSHAEFETPLDPVLEMKGWRWRDDSTALNTDAGWLAAENVNPATDDLELRRRLRVEVEETGGVAVTDGFRIEANLNSGGWNDATVTPLDWTTRTTLAEIEAMQSKQYVDKAAASTSLLTTSTATFDPDGDGVGETGVTGTDVAIAALGVVELEFCIVVHRVSDDPTYIDDGDTIQFRVVRDDGTVLDVYPTLPQITVNEPAGMLGGVYPENPGDLGPFEDANGNKYAVIEPVGTASLNFVTMHKSTDGDNWDEQDGAGRPGTFDTEGIHIIQDGDQLLVFHHRGSVVRLHTFNTSDHLTPDEWSSTDVDIDNGAHTDAGDQQITARLRSDGTIVAAWTGDTATDHEVWFNIRSAGGTWGTALALWDLASNDIEGVVSVLGDNDHVYLFCVDQPTGDLLGKRINGSTDAIEDLFGTGVAATVAGTVVDDNVGTTSDDRQGCTLPQYWNDGADKIYIAWKDATDGDLEGVVITVGGGGSVGSTVTTINDADDVANSFGGSRQPIASIIRHSNGDLHAFFATEPASGSLNNNLLHDVSTDDGDTWGTNTTVTVRSPKSRINWIRAHEQPGGEFALLYDDASGSEQNNDATGGVDTFDEAGLGTGFVWYDEFAVAAGGDVTLSGSGNAAADGNADFDVIVELAGGGDVASEGSAAASVTKELVGAGDAASEGSAVLTEFTFLSGAGDAASEGQATLIEHTFLAGSGDVAADGDAAASISKGLSGSGNAASQGQATLEEATFLAGAGDVASDGNAALTRILGLVGAGDAASDGNADFDVVVFIAGAGDAAAAGSASLDIDVFLVGGGDVAASATAVLNVDYVLAGAGDAASEGQATLEEATFLSGAGDAASEGVGTLDVSLSVAGTGNAAADGNAILDIEVLIAGAGDAASEGTAAANVAKGLVGGGDAASDGDAVLGTIAFLSGSGNAASAGSATLEEATFLAGSGDAAADGNAAASITRLLVGSGNAASQGQATLEEATFLSGSGNAAADGDAAASIARLLVGAGDAASDGSADFTIGAETLLSGAGDVASDGNAAASIEKGLVGAGDVAADGDAAASIEKGLVGAGDAASQGQATLIEHTFLAGAGDAASEGVGTLEIGAEVLLSGSGNAAADGSAPLTVEILIAGSGDAAADGDAAASIEKGLAGSGNAASEGQATLEEATFLSGSGNSASFARSSVTVEVNIAGRGNAASIGSAAILTSTFLAGGGDAAADGAGALGLILVAAGSGAAASVGSADLSVFIKAKLIQPVDSLEYDPSRDTRKPRTAVTASVEGRIG